MPHNSVQVTASGEQINDIVQLIDNATENKPVGHVAIACLVKAIISQNPFLTDDDLARAVSGASIWICDFFESIDKGISDLDMPVEKMN